MNLLLDTHAFLWFIAGDPKLSPTARHATEDEGNLKLVSIASLWEMAIKVSLGKLILQRPFKELIPRQIEANGFDVLPVRIEHVARLTSMPFVHRDPFDRMLVAQCLENELTVVSGDPAFDGYSIRRIW
jgi:PIN domain nuclease of toxin-antitoxin system